MAAIDWRWSVINWIFAVIFGIAKRQSPWHLAARTHPQTVCAEWVCPVRIMFSFGHVHVTDQLPGRWEIILREIIYCKEKFEVHRTV